jgi:outer membrane protein TolC
MPSHFREINRSGRTKARALARALCAAALVVYSGCATEQVSRSIETARRRSSRPVPGVAAQTDSIKDSAAGLASAEGPRPSAGATQPAGANPVVIGADLDIPVPAPTTIPPASSEYPIDLSTALRLAEVENPTIAIARARIIEALAVQQGALALLLPSLNPGTNYHLHTGNLQRSSGRILNLTEQSFYVGGGARTVAAESIGVPAVNIFSPLTDALYEPLAAHQQVISATFSARAIFNDITLDVAVLHLDLLANQAILDAQRLSESQVYQVAVIVNDFASTGAGRKADADRARAEWKLHRAAVLRAEEELAVSAARLANRLNLDPSVRLRPIGGPLVPVNLIALETETRDLVDYALRRRPEMPARAATISAAEYHRSQEVARPLLPTVWLGLSGGLFGGGSNIIPPTLAHFGGRTDFDVRLFWTFMNMGAGNLSLINRRQAQLNEAEIQRVLVINQIRREVTSARALGLAARTEIDIARTELASAESGFREDLDRSRQKLGRPIEVLNSLNLLAAARVNLIKALLQYDQAQFRLFVALGSPPPLPAPSADPVPPPPVTTPLHAPLSGHGHPLALGFEG